MNAPSLTELEAVAADAWPYLVSGGAVLVGVLTWKAFLAWRPAKRKTDGAPEAKASLENRLTFVVAVIAAGIAAQGMWRFFRDILDFPVELRIVAFAVLELVTFTCAMRARRNIREAEIPEDAKAGIDGIAVWVVTALSGAFSATDADEWPEAAFRLAMPLLAAWLWERGMSIERRRARGGSTIHLRLTPERVLVWLRIAEPSGRTASEVDAHRRLTRVAKAAAKVRGLRRDDARDWRIDLAKHRLDRAMLSAVAHAGLAADPARQQALIAQLGSMYNADALANLTPEAPWAGFTSLVQRTGFMVQGRQFTPVEFTPTRVEVRAEVQRPVQVEVHEPVAEQVHEPRPAKVQVHQPRELEPPTAKQGTRTEVLEPQVQEPPAEPRTKQAHQVHSTANLPDRAAKKTAEVQLVVNLIREFGRDAVTLGVVRERLGFTKTTAYNRLTEARELVNQDANQEAVNQ
ncbi:hypothetical protein [Actinomadura rubrisoli]|uniref:DUF2637 domain-containing protein n=1 Tax=Actinomadura rubrisoli TaxID=2530368 RepID=A0A4R5CJV1_9ACTN|nr:hypothetical protein [Actinomadura rubrisoli]TDD97684.1 hypothetical protein E1298_01215 [Actinomadura rubrisoli]